MDFRNRVVLITGASSGIGRAIAAQLAAKGARVALLARRAERLRTLADTLDPTGTRAIAVPADVSDATAVSLAIATAATRLGPLDCLVNAAGVAYFGDVAHMPLDHLDRVVRTNVYGVVHAVQAALPQLRQTRGMIVNVSSGLAKRALPFLAAYSGSKSMLGGLSDGLRLELRRDGIRVLTYCAPETETEFSDHALRAPGVPLPPARRRRQPAERVAARIVRAMERERREVVADPLFALAAAIAPGLLDAVFYRIMVVPLSRR